MIASGHKQHNTIISITTNRRIVNITAVRMMSILLLVKKGPTAMEGRLDKLLLEIIPGRNTLVLVPN